MICEKAMNQSIIRQAVELNDPVLAKQALGEIAGLLDASPDREERVYLLFSKASCYGILGQFAEAREQLSLALREKNDSSSGVTYDFIEGMISQQEGNYDEALQRFTATLSAHAKELKQPEFSFIYKDIQQRRGFLLVAVSRFQDAIPVLQEALSFDVDEQTRSDAMASLGLCYLELHENKLAKDHFLQARAIGLTRQWEGKLNFYLGMAYFYEDMFREAKQEFQKCEELAALHQLPITDIYAWLSSISKRLGERSESERYARLARPS